MRLRSAACVAAAALCATVPAAARAATQPPELDAKAAILIQPDTRDIVYARNADQRRPIASATKLMTALVTVEHMRLSDVVTTIDYHATAGESLAGFAPGERVTVADLLRAMLLPSANDAAATLAVRVAGSRTRFVAMMNAEARKLGLTETHYSTPVGLDSDANYSSARDLVELALALRRYAFVRETVAEPRATLRSGSHVRVVTNRNDLVGRDPAVDGIKTGHTTDAGYVLVGSATRDGVTVLSAVLGDPDEQTRDADSLALLRYGLRSYKAVDPVVSGRRLATAAIRDQGSDRVDLVAGGTATTVLRTGEDYTLRLVGVPRELEGPVPARTREGAVDVVRRGKVVATIPLVTARAVPKASPSERLRAWVGKGSTVALLAALAVCSLSLVLLRVRAVRRRALRTRAGEST